MGHYSIDDRKRIHRAPSISANNKGGADFYTALARGGQVQARATTPVEPAVT